jgi:hypothetical protein
MPLIAPLWAWIVGLLGSVVSTAASFFITRVAFDKAINYALITGFIVAASGLFLALVLTTKTVIFGARIAMPASLGAATYFLPPSLPVMVSAITTFRVSAAIYRWTVQTMSAYLPHDPKHGLLL